jgi:cytochrome oxidase Cu insertion factor (SCO1/SenC/PrrC family)
MMRRVAVVWLAALLLATPAVAAGPDFAGMQMQAYDPPRAAPAFTLPDLAGKPVRLEDLKGKVTLLVFWATW